PGKPSWSIQCHWDSTTSWQGDITTVPDPGWMEVVLIGLRCIITKPVRRASDLTAPHRVPTHLSNTATPCRNSGPTPKPYQSNCSCGSTIFHGIIPCPTD